MRLRGLILLKQTHYDAAITSSDGIVDWSRRMQMATKIARLVMSDEDDTRLAKLGNCAPFPSKLSQTRVLPQHISRKRSHE